MEKLTLNLYTRKSMKSFVLLFQLFVIRRYIFLISFVRLENWNVMHCQGSYEHMPKQQWKEINFLIMLMKILLKTIDKIFLINLKKLIQFKENPAFPRFGKLKPPQNQCWTNFNNFANCLVKEGMPTLPVDNWVKWLVVCYQKEG